MAGLVALTGPFAAPAVAAGQPLPIEQCRVADPRVAELSGLAADGERWYAVNDGGRNSTVFVLTQDCAVERLITAKTDPYDVEDLARGADGTFWLADTGDNDSRRDTVALIALTPDGVSTLYRLTYPDGPHDAEAILLDRTGVPYIVTKTPGSAGVYRPVGQLASPGPTALELVATVRFTPTDSTGGPVPEFIGSTAVTGGAISADGLVVALRTYTDAYLYPAPTGDVVDALGRTPVRIPLSGEPQGEAIAFEPDGSLLSASEGIGQPIRLVNGATDLAAQAPPSSAAPAAAGSSPPSTNGAATAPAEAGLDVIPAAAVTVAVVLVLMWFLHRRAKRRGRA